MLPPRKAHKVERRSRLAAPRLAASSLQRLPHCGFPAALCGREQLVGLERLLLRVSFISWESKCVRIGPGGGWLQWGLCCQWRCLLVQAGGGSRLGGLLRAARRAAAEGLSLLPPLLRPQQRLLLLWWMLRLLRLRIGKLRRRRSSNSRDCCVGAGFGSG